MARDVVQLPPDSTGKRLDAYSYLSTIAGSPTVYAQAAVSVSSDGSVVFPPSAALADATSNPTTSGLASYGSVWNGANWDLMRSANSASNSTGTGLLGVGMLAYDGTNFRLMSGIVGDSGQNAQVVAGGRKEVTFSTTTVQAVASTDVSNYRWVSVQVTGQGTGSTITFQGSNDNATWVSVSLERTDLSSIASQVVTNVTGNGIWAGPANFRYFRLNVTGISAGTTAGVVEFFAVPPTLPAVYVSQLQVPATQADAQANPTTTVVASFESIYNGATWERRRSAGSAANTTGTGLPGAGLMAYDGANWQSMGGIVGDSGQNAQLVAGNRKEVSFSTTTVQAVASTDVSNYRAVSVHITSQGTGSTITFQGSNDNVNWTSVVLYAANSATPNAASSATTTTNAIFHGAIPFRYFRLNVTGISAGTTAGVIEFTAFTAGLTSIGITTNGSVVGSSDGSASQAVTPVTSYGLLFTGAGWDRPRTPNIFKTVTATATGNTAIWTPTSGKKFRLMGFLIILTSNAAKSAAGLFEVTFQDSATATGLGFSSFVPAASGTVFTADNDSSWVLLGNGLLSAAANNVLNLNLSAALTAGEIRVTVMGTEE